MSAAHDLDPEDLSLPGLPDDIELESGPVIDSSDEFPLPSFGDEISADLLFPVDEQTAEELPAARAKPPVPPAAEKPRAPVAEKPAAPKAEKPPTPAAEKPAAPKAEKPPTPAAEERVPPKAQEKPRPDQPKLELPAAELPDFSTHEVVDLPPFPAEGQSLDDDYFEEGLEEEKPASKETLKVPLPPIPPEVLEEASSPPPGTSEKITLSVPSVTLDVDEFPSEPPLFTVSSQSKEPLTAPGAPQASVESKQEEADADAPVAEAEDLFFEARQATAQETPPPSKEQVSREDWVEEVPVEEYVRKVQIRRRSRPGKPKFRPWIAAVGVLAVGAAYILSPPFFGKMNSVQVPTPFLVIGSVPKGQVFAGDELLGDTPLALTEEQAARQDLQIRKPGYETVTVPSREADKEKFDKVHTFSRPLQVSPVELSWSGIPEGSTIWWNGSKTEPSSLSKVQPGTYTLKVKVPDRPAISSQIQVEPREATAGALNLATAVEAEFAKQPKASIAVKAPDEKLAGKAISVSVKSLNPELPFATTLKTKSGDTTSVVLPGAGKYKVSFVGDSSFKAASQTFEAEAASESNLEIALAKQPPKPVEAQPQAGNSNPGYRPPAYRPYRPRPRPYYPSGGGSGGGGRIAPPAF